MAAADKAIRVANRSARGIFEFLERRPELHQNVGAHFLNALAEQIAIENVEVESRSGRRLLEGAQSRYPPARAQRSWGTTTIRSWLSRA